VYVDKIIIFLFYWNLTFVRYDAVDCSPYPIGSVVNRALQWSPSMLARDKNRWNNVYYFAH